MPARIPKIEVADDADPPRIGSKYNESDPISPVERHRVRTELVVEPLMGAFAEQIEIEIAQHRREAVGVLEFDDVVAEAGAQLVSPGAVRQRASEQSRIVNPRQRSSLAVLAHGLAVGGFWQDSTAHGGVPP